MRILQIAPLWEPVPPPAYGGTESVVHLLCEELVRMGHEVTLWAAGDSQTSARLESCLPYSLRTASWLENKTPYSWQHCALALRDAARFDIIHNQAGEEVMAMSHLVATPMLTTMHCLVTPDTHFVWEHYRGWYNTISRAQKRSVPELSGPRFAGVAYNAIDVESFPFEPRKDEYLLFLSRLSEVKGPHIAIEVARRSGRRLFIAGKVDEVDRPFFEAKVAPEIDGHQVVYVGEAGARLKRELYRHARAVLVPITWEEPFGLVLAEAQACGTPVLTFSRGAAPEIVLHGETGFLVETVDELVDAVPRAKEIDPHACRRWVDRRFGAAGMAARYLDLYRRVLTLDRSPGNERQARAPAPPHAAELTQRVA